MTHIVSLMRAGVWTHLIMWSGRDSSSCAVSDQVPAFPIDLLLSVAELAGLGIGMLCYLYA